MYKISKPQQTKITRNEGVKGEMLETKVERIVNNKEPIKDGAPIIYTNRAHGIMPQYNIRTDRFEIAIEAMDKVSKSYKARREERAKLAKESAEAKAAEPTVGKGEPTQKDPKA